jgi:hypothetical protein
MARQLVLLGDSVFDNKAYLQPGERDVLEHLRARLAPADWRAELWAVDGSVAADVPAQLERGRVEPPSVFVLSAGGNDALGYMDLLSDPSSDRFIEALLRLYDIREGFRETYAAALDRILIHGQPLIVCTIYDPVFADEPMQQAAKAALSVFNDVIGQEAGRRGLTVIELRDVCTDPADYANEIEPSERGGGKIADAILEALGQA